LKERKNIIIDNIVNNIINNIVVILSSKVFISQRISLIFNKYY